MKLQIPQDYKPKLDIKTTEIAINQIKDCFERTFSKVFNLQKVSAPLFVLPESGINDTLNNKENPVTFNISSINKDAEIVHSLAKWKRFALKKYGFIYEEGLYANMNSIRKSENLDNLHSIFVDQWDWEKVILLGERNLNMLKKAASQVFRVLKIVESYINDVYPILTRFLPEEIKFITTSKLEQMYPELTPKQREEKITREYKAVFIMQVGDVLKSGEKHGERAPDYDDWSLNGDFLVWFPILNCPLEISSMGIRVDEKSLLYQLEKSNCMERVNLPFHKSILNKELPYTIGGGIGQSRVCMFLLGKAHIGEVQPSIWPPEMIEQCAKSNIRLL